MRPGPGLVVMALAFISGARRGSTSTSSKSSSSTITSSNPSHSPFLTSKESEHESLTSSILFPGYLGGGGVLTTDTNSFSSYSRQETDAKNYRVNYYNYIYNTYSYLPPFVPPRHKTTHKHQHLRLETLSDLKSSSRATRQTRIIRSLNSIERNRIEERDGEISFGENVSKPEDILGSDIASGYEIKDGTISVEDKTGEGSTSLGTSVSADSEGLPVQFPSNSADTSKSFDDDDILALVAEDDLLSEESFDRLTKITNDKVGYLIVDDYDASTEDSTKSISESSKVSLNENHRQQKTHEQNYTVNKKSSGDDNGSGENSQFQNIQEHSNNKNKANVAKKVKKSKKGVNLSENKQNNHASVEEVADISYVTAFSQNGLSHTVSSENSESGVRNNKWSIFESESPLTRLNPWISACDLAQPGTAPDLQGQCSAGTLPMAWVDEGPGPPSCPISCEKLRRGIVNNFHTKFNNNNIMVIKNNDIHFKKPIENYYDTENLSQVRRDLSQWSVNNSNEIYDSKQEIRLSGTKITDDSIKLIKKSVSASKIQAPHTANTAIAHTLTSDNRQHHAVSNMVKMNTNKAEVSRSYEYADFINFGAKYESNADHLYSHKQNKQYNGYREQAQPTQQQKHQKQQQQKEQQCLDYLGDTEETSPAHLCTFKSPSELATNLRSLRLRHCCERNVFSALHTVALNATLSGGVECVRILMDLMDLDLLATRITCELAEILFRFDCRQVYSLIHQCDDCKEAYRRWVCSTLIPYFAEESDILESQGNNRGNSKLKNIINSENTIDKDEVLVDISTKNQIRRSFLNSADSVEHAPQRTKRQLNRNLTSSNYSPTESDVPNNNYKGASPKQSKRNMDGKCNQQEGKEWRQGQHTYTKQSNIFISTAINAESGTEDPVISKIIKRSKRSVQFRKRKRIRPCLSVCQTVEQKCPYLLPADRAPALPTQYAGEPTFLCLDQSIPETGEQLRKSSYGPAGCCYGYCNDISDGVCAYCSEFVKGAADASILVGNLTRRLHNITLMATSQYRLDARLEASLRNSSQNKLATSISIALSNSSVTAIAGQIDRLTSYALYDGIYFYDENTDDMPVVALSDDCPPVPSITSRCSIPYYASSAVAIRTQKNTMPNDVIGHHMLLLLSAMLCLLTSQTAARQFKTQIHPNQKHLRKYLQHCTKFGDIDNSALSSCVSHKEKYTVIHGVNISGHLMLHSKQYMQHSSSDTDIKHGFSKSKEIRFSFKDPSMPTIFPKSPICTNLIKGIHDSDSSQHCVESCERRIHFCMEKNFVISRSRCRIRNKNNRRWGNRKWKRNQNRIKDLLQYRKIPISAYIMTDKYRKGKPRKEKRIRSTKYNDSVKNAYVQLNIENNNKITFRLNSKLYFNSNTKIYRRKESTIIRNFNIATITDNNKNHINRIMQTITSNENKFNCNYIYYNCSYKKTIIGRIQFTNMDKRFQFIYYYNFNINDWWRRWCWCIWDSTGTSKRVPSVIL
ncbi:uncharacterized protein Mid1 [Eurosta solidaginis]|uniref:uncharacterized protein Mid1 n=1 Tax=Eurosta solidaginis TaxID=178769 RepID=UPI00353108BD